MPASNRTSASNAKNISESEERVTRQAAHEPTADLMEYLRDYAREKPEAAALWCFGIGFVLGWKLKPW